MFGALGVCKVDAWLRDIRNIKALRVVAYDMFSWLWCSMKVVSQLRLCSTWTHFFFTPRDVVFVKGAASRCWSSENRSSVTWHRDNLYRYWSQISSNVGEGEVPKVIRSHCSINRFRTVVDDVCFQETLAMTMDSSPFAPDSSILKSTLTYGTCIGSVESLWNWFLIQMNLVLFFQRPSGFCQLCWPFSLR